MLSKIAFVSKAKSSGMIMILLFFMFLLIACGASSPVESTPVLPFETQPVYIGGTFPPSQSSISSSEIQDLNNYTEDWYKVIAQGGDVCLKLIASHIVEPNDYLGPEELQERVTLWVNNQEVKLGDLVFNPILETKSFVNGQEAKYSSPIYMCWPIELESGIQVILFEYQKPSGEKLSYSWYFKLTE